MTRKDKIFRTVTAIVAAAVLICSIVIVTLRLGLVEGYDFGAGAYYYADIPGFEKIMNDRLASAQRSSPMITVPEAMLPK